MISTSLSNKLLTLPFFCACCCRLAIAVTHICDIASDNIEQTKTNNREMLEITLKMNGAGDFFKFHSQSLTGLGFSKFLESGG